MGHVYKTCSWYNVILAIHGCMDLYDTRVVFWATYDGTSWNLAKGTGTVDGKPGHIVTTTHLML